MEFEVLGPLRVRGEGRPAPLTAAMPRTLLAILLTRANTSVSVDLLVDALWAGEPDPRAAKKLQLHVHRLRRALGDPARIRFEHAGYTLRIDPDELDAHRFETLLTEGADRAGSGDPDRAVQLLRSALRLWRGDPFGDLADVPMLRAEADRLTERRLAGLEDLHGAQLAVGHAGVIVPELVELAARNPLRERLQGLLMTALYRAGRQAEALEVFRRTRAVLIDELALEPGTELRRLEHAILTGDPTLDAPAAPVTILPAQLPADIADFTGRDAQLATLRRHLTADPGRPGPVLVSAIAGKGGVGKTSLAVHLAHQLRDEFPDGQLYVNLHGAGAHPLDPAEVQARFLRALGARPSAVPDDADERAASYRSWLAGRRMLILLDNAAGEAQVRPLLPGTADCAVLVTSRARLVGLDGARLVDLDILEPEPAVELLAKVAGPARVAAEPAAAEEIVRLCGWLPLAVRVAGARLGARRHWRLARLATDLADEHRRLDVLRSGDLEVRASLALSYDSLDGTAKRAFRLLGMLEAPDFCAWVAAALLDITQPRAERLVDTLVDAQLLDVIGHDAAGQVRYRFHDLLRAYAREVATAEEPAAERIAALERTLGGWLALAEDAGQRLASSAFGVTFDTVSGWRPDPTVTATVLADPLHWFEAEWAALVATVGQACSAGSDELTCALAARLAAFFVVRGYYDDWRRICHLMASAARHAGNSRWEGMALRGLGELSLLEYRLDEAIVCFERSHAAFGSVGEQHGQAVAMSGIGAAHVEARRFDDALVSLRHALVALRQVGDHRSEAWALRRLGTLHQLQGQHDSAAAYFEQALTVLHEVGDPIGEAGVLDRLGAVRAAQGRRQEARIQIERSLRLRRQHGDHFGEARALSGLGELNHTEASWEAAADCLGDALRLWRELRLPREQARTLARLAALHEAAGNPQAAQAARHEAQRLFAELGGPEPAELTPVPIPT